MTAWEHGDEYPNDKLRTEGGMKKRERALWLWVGGGVRVVHAPGLIWYSGGDQVKAGKVVDD